MAQVEDQKHYRYEFGGMLGPYLTVSATEYHEDRMCKCDICNDDSLYHDAKAWALDEPKDSCVWDALLCEDCFKSTVPDDKKGSYVELLTYH